MTKLEQIEFENITKFNNAISSVIEGEDRFREYTTQNNEKKSIKIIGNNNLYLGNGYSLSINQAESGKVYVSVQYFSADDKIAIAKHKKDSDNV